MNYNVFQDWKRNKGYIKGQLILLLFRTAVIFKSNLILTIIFFWYLVLYRFFVEWVLGIELPWNLRVGRGVRLYHGQSLVINGNTIIGENCTLRHCTTIGNKGQQDGDYFACPKIGHNVDIGANVCIIGGITIGDNVSIGAGTVVVKNIPSNAIAVGNPAKIILKTY